MFVQVIESRTNDPDALRGQLQRWERELMPGAVGYLGSTGGCTASGDLILLRAPSVTLRPDSNEAQLRGGTTQTIETRFVHDGAGQPLRMTDPEGKIATFEYYPSNNPSGGAPVPGAPIGDHWRSGAGCRLEHLPASRSGEASSTSLRAGWQGDGSNSPPEVRTASHGGQAFRAHL